MKKGQTSVRNGIEDLLCPFVYFGITQGANGSYSHKGTMANDIGHKDSKNPYEPYYAPCAVKCIYIWPDYGQAMWQSINKVRFADGSVDYLTFITVHDNSFNAYVGLIVKQGELLGHKGKKMATGVHCHIQCAKGLYTIKNWHQNQYGVWQFPNEVNIDNVFFFDETEINYNKIPSGYNLKFLKDVPVEEPKPEEPKVETLQIGDNVKIIGTGNGSSMGTANVAYGIGWTRQILKIWEGRSFPYQVGNSTGTTGFYREDALEKI